MLAVMGNKGGPHTAEGAAIHAKNANRKLMMMDISKKEEYDRRKKMAEIDNHIKMVTAHKRMAANLGWPFRALSSTNVREESDKEQINPMAPKPKVDEYLSKWKKGVLPGVALNPSLLRLSGTPDILVTVTPVPCAKVYKAANPSKWADKAAASSRLKGKFTLLAPSTDGDSLSFYLAAAAAGGVGGEGGGGGGGGEGFDVEKEMEKLRGEMEDGAPWFKELLLNVYGSNPKVMVGGWRVMVAGWGKEEKEDGDDDAGKVGGEREHEDGDDDAGRRRRRMQVG